MVVRKKNYDRRDYIMGVMMVLKKLVDGDRLIVADDCGNNY